MQKRVSTIIIITLASILFTACTPPNMSKIELDKDPNLYAGKGEVCENPYLKLECQKGLECMLVASKPNIIKVCYPPETILEEDLINRHLYDNENYAKGTNSTYKTE